MRAHARRRNESGISLESLSLSFTRTSPSRLVNPLNPSPPPLQQAPALAGPRQAGLGPMRGPMPLPPPPLPPMKDAAKQVRGSVGVISAQGVAILPS